MNEYKFHFETRDRNFKKTQDLKKKIQKSSIGKLLILRHDFYTNDELDYDSISYFTSIEHDLIVLEILKRYLKKQDNILKIDLEELSADELWEVKRWIKYE